MANRPQPIGSARPGEPSGPAQSRWTGRSTPVGASARATASAPVRRGSARPEPTPPGPRKPAPTYDGGDPSRRRRPWRRVLLVVSLVIALVVGVSAAAGYLWARNVNEDLKRTDPFTDLAGRPQKLAEGTLNILMLGTDSRDPDAPVDQASKWRTDTIMIMHIPANHEKAYLISLPRDLWVHVPRSKDGQSGNVKAKINAAYAWGGAPLMVQTVEEFTGVRIDHLVLIDFAGFARVTDALGGVDMTVDQTFTSIFPPYRTFTKGTRHFDGTEALDFVRQRKQFPDSDFTRIRHQQMFLRALLDKAVSVGTVTNLSTFREFVSATAAALTVDQDFSLIDLGWQFRNLRGEDLVFLVSPHKGSDTIDGESVVVSDSVKARAWYEAMAADRLSTVISTSPSRGSGG